MSAERRFELPSEVEAVARVMGEGAVEALCDKFGDAQAVEILQRIHDRRESDIIKLNAANGTDAERLSVALVTSIQFLIGHDSSGLEVERALVIVSHHLSVLFILAGGPK